MNNSLFNPKTKIQLDLDLIDKLDQKHELHEELEQLLIKIANGTKEGLAFTGCIRWV